MKKILFSLVLFMVMICDTFAQREYLTLCTVGQNIILSGTIPNSIKKLTGYKSANDGSAATEIREFGILRAHYPNYIYGNILNIANKEGFVIDKVLGDCDRPYFVLVREPKNGTSSSVKGVTEESYGNTK